MAPRCFGVVTQHPAMASYGSALTSKGKAASREQRSGMVQNGNASHALCSYGDEVTCYAGRCVGMDEQSDAMLRHSVAR